MKQIVIVKKNRVGLLADISELIASKGINIGSVNGVEVGDLAVFRMEVQDDRYDESLRLLRDNCYDAVSENAVLIKLRDEPGALAKITRRFKDAGVNMNNIRIIRRESEWGLVAVGVDDIEEGKKLLKDLIVTGE